MSKIILGIDPGIADTGFGVIEFFSHSKMTSLDYGSIKTPAGQDLEKRLLQLSLELEKIFKRYKPQILAIEQLFFNKNIKTALTVAQARGVVMLFAAKHSLEVQSYTPLQIKQSVSCYGQAQKMQVQKMVKLILGLKVLPKPDDAADALAAAICASSTLKFK
ncbi:MAG: crossover junction endodeoxyribonuclease RuvC [Candidatus Pacebacteria bacterium]|nr:crossover junction endodeoxyribonuclease RuvC [Candidatus Paceibacterota bacterium]